MKYASNLQQSGTLRIFAMFDEMVNNICIDAIKVLLTFGLCNSAGFGTRYNNPDHEDIVMLCFFRREYLV